MTIRDLAKKHGRFDLLEMLDRRPIWDSFNGDKNMEMLYTIVMDMGTSRDCKCRYCKTNQGE